MIPRFQGKIRFELVTLMVLVGCTCGYAQPKMKTTSGKGTITDAAAGVLQIRADSGEFWLLRPDGPDITFVATAHKDWLAPRMIVRIEGTFDRKGVGQADVDIVQVFTPRPEYQLGAFSAAGEATRRREESQALVIAGPISRREGDELRVTAGKKTFTVRLAEDAKVEVDLIGDLNWVRPGDKVEYMAGYYQVGLGIASKLNVESPLPLVPVVHHRERRRRDRQLDKTVKNSKDAATESEEPGSLTTSPVDDSSGPTAD